MEIGLTTTEKKSPVCDEKPWLFVAKLLLRQIVRHKIFLAMNFVATVVTGQLFVATLEKSQPTTLQRILYLFFILYLLLFNIITLFNKNEKNK